ncbi:MAG: bifunctional UDP-N-acetylglucosamine diphosphorylase/glucosamine-1-phosphate N-acetyltransferase GlmU [Chloroflexota bacterium]|nr:bifunctional UDP-N-acetylglucosamine diphosphorylase/glucosamine-1-phosphate N-acetyltransferase GlmU [Chloroflexota bacterium]
MRSRVPKVLHPVAGRPMIDHVLDALDAAGMPRPVVVTGHDAERVEAAIADRADTVRQPSQRGTADAVRVALDRIPQDAKRVLVTSGDAPLQPPELFRSLVGAQADGTDGIAIAMVTARMADPSGYGRVVRDGNGGAARIVEDRDLPDRDGAPGEINVGTYCFDAAWLRERVASVAPSASGELYLTDLVAAARADGRRVMVCEAPNPELTMGVNDRVQLAEADRLMRRRINERHMRAGVTIIDPATTFIDVAVAIARDARIEPWTIVRGRSTIEEDAVIGPGSEITDSRIGPRSVVARSVVEESVVSEDCSIGPFAHLRPGSEIGPRCRIGNYAEIKSSRIGADTQSHHFSYIGDAEVGERVNVGAGTVTANYDGEKKNRTVVGDGAFLGVDTMLRAPVTIGRGARTGAGSVVTRDVPDGKTVVGMPARPIEARRRARAVSAAPPETTDA